MHPKEDRFGRVAFLVRDQDALFEAPSRTEATACSQMFSPTFITELASLTKRPGRHD